MLVVVALCTLSPFQFSWPSELRISVACIPSDIVLNVCLFVIPGFLFQASRSSQRNAATHGMGFGLCCSLLIEATQLLLPMRYPSPFDLATNALGAAIGAILYTAIQNSVKDRAVNQLFLKLPLMGSFYLLVPLLWLTSLTATSSADLLGAPLLGFTGAILLASVWKHRLQTVHGQAWVGLAIGIWYLVGSVPALMRWPLPTLCSAVVVALLAFALASSELFLSGGRRFEMYTLARAMPMFGLYLLSPLLLDHLPLVDALDVPLHANHEQARILSGVEQLAAFSVLGYLVGERTGRWEGPSWGPALLVVVGSLFFALCRGYGEHAAAHELRGLHAVALALCGGLCGLGIYVRQLATLREWIASQST